MASLILELVINYDILFSLHAVFVTFNSFIFLLFNCLHFRQDDALCDCFFHFAFVVYITNIAKNIQVSF